MIEVQHIWAAVGVASLKHAELLHARFCLRGCGVFPQDLERNSPGLIKELASRGCTKLEDGSWSSFVLSW